MITKRPWTGRLSKKSIAILKIVKDETGITHTAFIESLILREARTLVERIPALSQELEKMPVDYNL